MEIFFNTLSLVYGLLNGGSPTRINVLVTKIKISKKV